MLLALTCNAIELLGGGQVIKTTFERRPISLGALAKVLRHIRMPVFYAEMEATLSKQGRESYQETGSVFPLEVAGFIPTWCVW